MAQIMKIDFTEAVSIDEHRLFYTIRDLDEVEASDLIDSAMHQLTLQMRAISSAVRNGELRQISADAEQLARLAWKIGLTSLARIAKDLATCAKQGNVKTLPAIEARISRVGDRSLAVMSRRHDPSLRPSG